MHVHAKTFNARASDRLASTLGSMRSFWIVTTWLFSWIIVMGLWRHSPDPFPYPFALFLTNIVQFFSVFIIQNSQNRQQAHLEAILTHLMEEENAELEQMGATAVKGDPLTGN